MGESGLTISSSIVFCTQFGAPGGKVKLSGSPVFRRGSNGGGEVWGLAESATISRDMTVPPGKNCQVPAGRTLSIAKGKRLYVFGSLVVDGTLKGAAVQKSGAGSVSILGSSQIAKGRSVRLTGRVVPAVTDGQADQAVSWSSDSPRHLSVSDKGVVTATSLSKPGDTANITCRALDGTGVEETVRMTVTGPVVKLVIMRGGAPVARLSASRGEGPVELDARVGPEGASSSVRWTSSSPAVASVDPETGAVRLLKKGTATISCAATDGTNTKALVKLTVK
jgi:alpha-amylase